MCRLVPTCLGFFIFGATLGAVAPLQKMEMQGTLKGIYPDKREFLLNDKQGKQWSFQLAEEGKVLINKKEGKLSDLLPGEDVAVSYEMRMERAFATEVRCKRD